MLKLFERCRTLDSIFKDASRDELLICLGMTIDYWAARNNDDPAEIIHDLSEVSNLVNTSAGRVAV